MAGEISCVLAELIWDAAILFGKADRAAIYWSISISQSVHGTDNALSLANLALLTGNMGKLGAGLNSLRRQNNVQGCSDSGGLPAVFPGIHSVADPEILGKFEDYWGVKLNPEPGLTTMEMVDPAENQTIKAYYVMGEITIMSEPDLRHARHVMEQMDFVLYQDIFLNETGEYADVILPAGSFAEKRGTFTNSDRRVQLVRLAIPNPGESRPDWIIIRDLASRVEKKLGREHIAGFKFENPAQIWDEMADLTPLFQGINHERIERESGVHWPCPTKNHPGTPYLFQVSFLSGKGKLTPLEYNPSAELPDQEYPFFYPLVGCSITGMEER